MSNIYLVGFMGAGKSTVGGVLAARLGYGFLDLDERLIERFSVSVPEIFERFGEDRFRTAESEELFRTCELSNMVVATGGGAFCSARNREYIHRSGGISVFLDLGWEEVCRRLPGDNADRPKFSKLHETQKLFEDRMPDYRYATITIELGGQESSEEIVDSILEAFQGVPCAT